MRLLRSAGLAFEQRPASIDESPRDGEPAEKYVQRLAEEKASAVWCRGCRTLGADTVVVLGDQVLCKPRDESHARSMLRSLSGGPHRVLTGVSVFDGEGFRTDFAETQVRFRPMGDAEIAEYVATGEPLDKAGGYGLQGGAAAFVESVEGSRSNVVGLPLHLVFRLLG